MPLLKDGIEYSPPAGSLVVISHNSLDAGLVIWLHQRWGIIRIQKFVQVKAVVKAAADVTGKFL